MGGGYSGDGGWLEDAVLMVGGWRVQGGVQASYIYIYNIYIYISHTSLAFVISE